MPRPDKSHLRRVIGFPVLVLYGLGTMVGGGFYALTGKVAGQAGMAAPLAFVVASSLAILCALAFAEWSARVPQAAGSARYVETAFGSAALGGVVGWLMISTGIVSAATLAVATVGFIRDLLPVPELPAIVLLVAAMTAVAAWGIGEAAIGVVAITVIEVGALVYILFVAGDAFALLPERAGEVFLPVETGAWIGVLSGGFLAFYAFIGFEDMVTLAEEVRDVRRNLPRAVIVSVVLTLLLYVSVATVAVLALPPAELAAASTPLATLVAGQGPAATIGIGIVSILTGINGALVQVVMAARIAYGMARRGQAPGWLGRIDERLRTPLPATLTFGAVILLFALSLDLTTLARLTSGIIIVVFGLVNAGLWWFKGREGAASPGLFSSPRFVSLLGALACVAILLVELLG